MVLPSKPSASFPIVTFFNLKEDQCYSSQPLTARALFLQDVNRTYRDHMMFRERYNGRQKALFHVLAAYSMYNTEVGYCQGMSQVRISSVCSI